MAHLLNLPDNLHTGNIGERLRLPHRPISGSDLEVGVVDGRRDAPDPNLVGASGENGTSA
jgi:hypothetical protein